MEHHLKKIILLLLVFNEITGLPQYWFDKAREMTTTNSPFTEFSDTEAVLSKIVTTTSSSSSSSSTSMTDGKIVFPSNNEDDNPKIGNSTSFIPKVTADCKDVTYCEFSSNYPEEVLENTLISNKIKIVTGVDMVPEVIHRVNIVPEEAPLCETTEKVVYPKVAKTKSKEWLFVVNQGNYTQGVRVETCGKERSSCKLIDGFAEGYKTICKQKYIYRTLLAVSPNGQIKPDMFRFPASCCCHVIFTGNPYLRFGQQSSITKKT